MQIQLCENPADESSYRSAIGIGELVCDALCESCHGKSQSLCSASASASASYAAKSSVSLRRRNWLATSFRQPVTKACGNHES